MRGGLATCLATADPVHGLGVCKSHEPPWRSCESQRVMRAVSCSCICLKLSRLAYDAATYLCVLQGQSRRLGVTERDGVCTKVGHGPGCQLLHVQKPSQPWPVNTHAPML